MNKIEELENKLKEEKNKMQFKDPISLDSDVKIPLLSFTES